jgi:hypothetical protein
MVMDVTQFLDRGLSWRCAFGGVGERATAGIRPGSREDCRERG